jgi:hypothetical protein
MLFRIKLTGFKSSGEEKLDDGIALIVECMVAYGVTEEKAAGKMWFDAKTKLSSKRMIEVSAEGKPLHSDESLAMFTVDDMRTLLHAKPFVPFRLRISDGGEVEVRRPEVVLLGKRFAVIGLLDANATDTLLDRWTVVWYLHVSRAEQLDVGAPPFASPPGTAPSSTPTPA